jgi:hypothetical protein
MAISVTATRPKAASTVNVTVSAIAKATTESGSDFLIPICLDNLAADTVSLTGLSFTSGSPTITGNAVQLANVKVGSVITTSGTTSDFASGTYVTAKPTSTTLTVSTNALRTQSNIAADAVLTVDATIAILKVNVDDSGNNIRLSISAAIMDGTKAYDANGNGYDDVAYSDGTNLSIGNINFNLDTFLTNFGKARVNA